MSGLRHYRVPKEIVTASHPRAVDGLSISYMPDDTATTVYDFSIVWVPVQRGVSPKLSMFNDAWGAITAIPELFDGLIELGEDASVERVLELLVDLGSQPYGESPP